MYIEKKLLLFTGNYRSREDFVLTQDIEREISSENPINQRSRAIKDLCDVVLNHQCENVNINNLYNFNSHNVNLFLSVNQSVNVAN